MKAIFIKLLKDWFAEARLYKLDPPINEEKYAVITSAEIPTGYEMIIWPSDKDGNIKSHNGLKQSKRCQYKEFKLFIELFGYVQVGDVKRKPR